MHWKQNVTLKVSIASWMTLYLNSTIVSISDSISTTTHQVLPFKNLAKSSTQYTYELPMGFGNILDLQFLLLWLSSGKMNHTLGKVYYPWGSRTMKDSSGKNSITIIKSWYYFFRINLFFFSVIIVPLHFARTVCYTLTLIFFVVFVAVVW